VSGWRSVRLPLRRRALPRPGRIELWLTELGELPLAVGPEGSGRKEQVLRRRIHQQFLVRLLLGSYLGLPGKDVSLVRSERGKPELPSALAESGLSFNLSHSGDWLAIAVARDIPVGVDIECQRQLRRPIDLARRFFPLVEAEWLAGLEEPELSEAFIEQWTAREALVKATGSSLAEALSGLALDWSPASIRSLPPGWPRPEKWSLIRPDMPAGVIGHVAAPAAGMALDGFFLQAG
jgi:4'-phosphopantetheinyl transferase